VAQKKKISREKAARATSPSPENAPEGQSRRRWAPRALLSGLGLYALVRTVLTADQIFDLGLYPPRLDRMIIARIGRLADRNLSVEERTNIEEWLISYHEFAVPHLLKALKKGEPAVVASATRCLQDIALKFFEPYDPRRPGQPTPEAKRKIASFGSDPVLWEGWWIETRARLEKAVPM